MRKVASSIALPLSTALILGIGLGGCATAPKPDELPEGQIDWPAPPEQTRYRYIMSVYNSDNIRVKSDTERLQELLAGKKNPAYELNRPLDVAVTDGMIYLIDSTATVIHVLDLPRQRYFNFGFRFEGKLGQPVGITVDAKGLVYVSDRVRNMVLIYDAFGLYVDKIDLTDFTTQIAGIATNADGNRVYVVDRGGIDSNQHQFVIIDRESGNIRRIGTRGKEAGQFNLPVDIAVDSEGNLYLLDAGNFRVQQFSPQGKFIKSWGSAGNGLGQFGMPRNIAIDADDHIYVSDAQFGNVQVFNTEGQLLLAIGRISAGSGPGLYSLITGVAVDERNHLYVLDQFFKKMDIYRKLKIK